MSDYKPFAFVPMPFHKEFDDLYTFGIKNCCEEVGVLAERVDEQHFSETILAQIYRQIESSDFVIAEMTGRNPNVFYEVGYAHAKNKLCALLTQNSADIPFDLKQHPHVIYDGSVGHLCTTLTPRLKWLVNEVEKSRGQSLSVAGRALGAVLESSEYSDTGVFQFNITLRNRTSRRSPEIEAIYVRTGKDWVARVRDQTCPYELVSDGNSKRHLITPSLRRLSPNTFSLEQVVFRKVFWSRYGGQEKKEEYEAKGTVTFEVVTSEGTIREKTPVDLKFADVPF